MRTLIGAVVLLWAAGAAAEDAKARRKSAEAELAEIAKATNAACGTKLGAEIVWKSFAPADLERWSIASFCGAPLTELADFCAGAKARAHIAKKVKAVRCRFGGPGKRALTVKNGVVELAVDWEAANYEAFAARGLLERL